ERRRSLLAAGVTGIGGTFHAGDVVGLVGPDGRTVARGVVAYDASELDFMIGFSTQNLPPDLQRPVVHADDLARL
ncbi:PUA domain-containing protein, partial [Rhodococcus sp. O3]|uniref:PUA domain-containing protein n=1 Tax=Rhodococcus sp. O3 TaxID=3404919 RepID=UPI003B680F9C